MTDQRPRSYGMAVERDPEGRPRDGDPGAAPRAVADPHPDFVHALPGEGRTILVEETSGVAFAEVTGAVTTPEPPAAEREPAPAPAPMPEPVAVPLFLAPPAATTRPLEPDWLGDAAIALGLAAAALLAAALRRALRREPPAAPVIVPPAPTATAFQDPAGPRWDATGTVAPVGAPPAAF